MDSDDVVRAPVIESNPYLQTALIAHKLGLSPVPPREDGSKAPLGAWKTFQTVQPSVGQIEAWYADGRTGNGLVSGLGDLRNFDFDTRQVHREFIEVAELAGLGELVSRIRAGYEEFSPGGAHWLFKCPGSDIDTTLARRLKTEDEFNDSDREAVAKAEGKGKQHQPIKALIEQTTYLVTAPSNGNVHPSGLPYVLQSGGLEQIANITLDELESLQSLARMFDQMPVREASDPEPKPKQHDDQYPDIYMLPGADFNEQGTIADALEDSGWTWIYNKDGIEHYRRPGKDHGISGTWNPNRGKHGTFICFSTNTTLRPYPASYTLFGLYTNLHHSEGEFTASTFALAQKGWGRWIDNGGEIKQNPPPKDWVREGREQAIQDSPDSQGNQAASKDSPSGSPADDATESESSHIQNKDSRDSVASLWTVKASTFKIKPVKFLDGGIIPAGKMISIVGMGGAGKGMFWANLVADFSMGRAAMDMKYEPSGAIEVLLVGCEDGYEDTVIPRLMAANANLDNIHILKGIKDKKGKVRSFSLEYLEETRRWFEENSKIRFMVIDPLPGYVARAGIDDHSDAELRSILEPFNELGASHNVTICGVKHFNKDESKSVSMRVTGSVAYVNIPRACYVVGSDPTNPHRRVLATFKWNLNVPRPPSIAWSQELADSWLVKCILESEQCKELAESDKDLLKEQLFNLRWEGEVNVKADDILERISASGRKTAREDLEKATLWLAARLKDGPVLSKVCAEEGEKFMGKTWPSPDGITPEEHERRCNGRTKWWRETILKGRLNGESRQHGFRGSWYFLLAGHSTDGHWPPKT